MKKTNNIKNLDDLRVEALIQFLEVEVEDVDAIITDGYDKNKYAVYGGGYLVLTDEEATLYTKANIIETCSYFTADFLETMTGIPAVVFKHLVDENEAVLETIEKTCGIDEFVDEAIRWDGRGHFIGCYDGEENEATIENEDGEEVTLYIYRVN